MKRLGVFLHPPGLDASPSKGYPQLIKIRRYPFLYLYTWVERGTVRVSVLQKNTTQCPRPGLAPGRLDPVSSALTMRPPRLYKCETSCNNGHVILAKINRCSRNKLQCNNSFISTHDVFNSRQTLLNCYEASPLQNYKCEIAVKTGNCHSYLILAKQELCREDFVLLAY